MFQVRYTYLKRSALLINVVLVFYLFLKLFAPSLKCPCCHWFTYYFTFVLSYWCSWQSHWSFEKLLLIIQKHWTDYLFIMSNCVPSPQNCGCLISYLQYLYYCFTVINQLQQFQIRIFIIFTEILPSPPGRCFCTLLSAAQRPLLLIQLPSLLRSPEPRLGPPPGCRSEAFA